MPPASARLPWHWTGPICQPDRDRGGAAIRIAIDRDAGTPIYLQIARQIREAVARGDVPPGFRLPPERRLARELGVNRSTVLNAYADLKSEGLVDAHVGRGTLVLPPPAPSSVAAAPALSWRQLFRSGFSKLQDPLVRDLLELGEGRDGITLSVGLPAPELLPVDALRTVLDDLLGRGGTAFLQHCPTEGHPPLRASIASLMAGRGVACTAEDVIVVSGSQQGLDLVARVLLDPGDAVIVEEPTFFGALQVFRWAQARLIGVPVDAHGMCTDELEALLERHRPKLIYTLPTFQNPSGTVLALERRHRLLELAARYQVAVLEDDPYGELRYSGSPVPSLKSLDRTGHVLYLSTFSKVLFPGLRLGWMVGPRPVLRQIVLAKQAVDLHSNTTGQWLLDGILRRNLFEPHLATVRQAYSRRLDVMDTALDAGASSTLSWRRPDGGFYVWCRLADAISPARLLARAAEAGVAFLPGGPCFPDEPSGNYLRLNFSFSNEREIEQGVARLLGALREVDSEPSRHAREAAGTRPIV